MKATLLLCVILGVIAATAAPTEDGELEFFPRSENTVKLWRFCTVQLMNGSISRIFFKFFPRLIWVIFVWKFPSIYCELALILTVSLWRIFRDWWIFVKTILIFSWNQNQGRIPRRWRRNQRRRQRFSGHTQQPTWRNLSSWQGMRLLPILRSAQL